MASSDINLRIPGKYTSPNATSASTPSIEWLHHKWTVTHSSLKRWRTAQNLSITYGPLPASPDGKPRISDTVAYQAKGKGKSKMKTISGVDKAVGSDDATIWDWRGSGLLKPISCRWEILGWGERNVGKVEAAGEETKTEKWVVTWFAPTIFTEEGVDIYCDREEGMSEETAALIRDGLEGLEAQELAALVKEKLAPVAIHVEDLPGMQG